MTATLSPSQIARRQDLTRIVFAYLGFIAIGLNSALLGLAWIPLRAEFGQPNASLGILLIASTIGYLTTSFLAGSVTGRIGIGWTVIAGAACMGLGIFLIGTLQVWGLLPPTFPLNEGTATVRLVNTAWTLLFPIYILSGVGSGLIDAGLNAYVAEHHSKRALNWLHASFGVGTTLAPLLVTAVVGAAVGFTIWQVVPDTDWRTAYLIVAAFVGALTVGLFFMRGRWLHMAAQTTRSDGGVRISLLDTLRLPAVWLGVVLFFFYAGMEASPGSWMGPLYNEARGIDLQTAGFWVSVYWGSFTIGRIFFGFIIEMFSTRLLMRVCLAGALIGAGLMVWNPTQELGFFGLALFGFAQAPMFPIFISLTPGWVGARHTPNAIGFQVAAAGVGIALIPAGIGRVAEGASLEIVPPVLLVAAVLVVVLYELIAARSARSSPLQ